MREAGTSSHKAAILCILMMAHCPGPSHVLLSRSDGLAWAALINTRDPESKMGAELYDLMWNIVDGIVFWPSSTLDLFSLYDDPWAALFEVPYEEEAVGI